MDDAMNALSTTVRPSAVDPAPDATDVRGGASRLRHAAPGRLSYSSSVEDFWDVMERLAVARFHEGSEPYATTFQVSGVDRIASIAPVAEPTRQLRDGRAERWLVLADDYTFAAFRRSDGSMNVTVSAPSGSRRDEIVAAIHAKVPKPVDDGLTEVSFWFMEQRARTIDRRVAAPTWPDIRRNYPAEVATRIDGTMAAIRPAGRGRLLLWHGPPGTGKTTAARALARAWAPWCRSTIVAEPERLFASAGLIFDLLTDDSRRAPDGGPLWTLLVVEDADELLRADARSASGQALSRLLNLADGFMGQGMDLLILLSTNERLNGLHPAVARPGRCLAQVEFPRFSHTEATAWLERDAGPGVDHSLAELIARRDGTEAPSVDAASRPGQYL